MSITKQRYVTVLADVSGEVITPPAQIGALVKATYPQGTKPKSNKKKSPMQNTSSDDREAQAAYDRFIRDNRIDPKMVRAIISVESGGYGFVNGQIVSRFEPHQFVRRYTSSIMGTNRVTKQDRKANGVTVTLPGMNIPTFARVLSTDVNGVSVVKGYDIPVSETYNRFNDRKRKFAEKQRLEWIAINKAAELDQTIAYESTSFGVGQIMGFNHKIVGYDTVQAMVSAFSRSIFWQRLATAKFIFNNKTTDPKTGMSVLQAVRDKNFDAFARLYNGDTTGRYASNLRAQYNKA
jgi:hypothetical protein